MNKQFSETDITKAINYLKTNHSEIPATREEAIKLLSGMQSFSKSFVETLDKLSDKKK